MQTFVFFASSWLKQLVLYCYHTESHSVVKREGDRQMSQTNQNNTGTLKYDVMVEQTNGKGYTARLLAWPETVVEAPTREKALQQMRALLLERLAKADIVTLEIQPTEIGHSWAPFAGMWADDPSFEEFQAEIQRYRREVDETWAPWLFEEEGAETAEQPEKTKVMEVA